MAKRVKLTRRSYKRNLVVFGLMLFMGIALTSTGFAAWVLSQDTNKEVTGNVEVGTVTDNQLQIADLKYYTAYDALDSTKNKSVELDSEGNPIFNFKFEPTEEDTTGRVKNNGVDFEQMTLYIVGKVTPTVAVANFNVSLSFTQAEQIQAAVDKGYIVLPEFAKEGGANVTLGGTSTGGNATLNADGTFVIKVSFAWGTTFGGVNPGEYYDLPETSTIGYEEMKNTLMNFRQLVHNEQYAEDGSVVESTTPTFKILITVTAK